MGDKDGGKDRGNGAEYNGKAQNNIKDAIESKDVLSDPAAYFLAILRKRNSGKTLMAFNKCLMVALMHLDPHVEQSLKAELTVSHNHQLH